MSAGHLYVVFEKMSIQVLWSILIRFSYIELYEFFVGEGNGTPLQYSCLENPMDGGAWKAAVHGVAEGRTRLSDFTFHFVLRCEPKAYLTVKKAWILELGNRDQISTNFVNLRKLLNISEFRFSLSLNGEGFILHSDSNI